MTTTAQWISLIGVLLGVFGWFVASVLRLYETSRQNRHVIYAKVLGPVMQMLATLDQARFEDRPLWRGRHEANFDKSLTDVITAAGEVQLIRKNKVSWTARRVCKTLEEARTLPKPRNVDDMIDCMEFRDQVTKSRRQAQVACDDFLLMAGRSLESWPFRVYRDRESRRRADIKRIEISAQEFRMKVEEKQQQRLEELKNCQGS